MQIQRNNLLDILKQRLKLYVLIQLLWVNKPSMKHCQMSKHTPKTALIEKKNVHRLI